MMDTAIYHGGKRGAGLWRLLAAALALLLALPLCAPAGAAYAKGVLAEGDSVKNVLVYVRNAEGENVLAARLPVADMVDYLNDHFEEIGKVHNYALLDKYVTTVHQEAQGFTVPQLWEYMKGMSALDALDGFSFGQSDDDKVAFWEIDGSAFDGADTYTYANLYQVTRYNFPDLYTNFETGSPSGQYKSPAAKAAVWASREEEETLLSITAFSQRYFLLEDAQASVENYYDNHSWLDTAKTMRLMLPQTEEDFNNERSTASDSRWGLTRILFDFAADPALPAGGKVEKPAAAVIDGDEDAGDAYEGGYWHYVLSCETEGAEVLYNDASDSGYTPTALYTGTPVKIAKQAGQTEPPALRVQAVKEGWSDAGVVSVPSGASDDEDAPEIVSPDADVWDGVSTDVSWYDGHEDEATYSIRTAAQLAGLAALTNRKADAGGPVDFAGRTFLLETDIHLADKEWTPIADDKGQKANNGGTGLNLTAYNLFSGIFEGNGHTISGLNIRAERYGSERLGLFGYLDAGGAVRNLTISGSDTLSSRVGSAGAAVGWSMPGSLIENVTNRMNLSAPSLVCNLGGIVGLGSGTIRNCVNYGTVTLRIQSSDPNIISQFTYAGGVAGVGSPVGCVNYGKVRGNAQYLGGIAGSGTVTGCENYGTVTPEHKDSLAGGITGTGSPTDCVNYAALSTEKDGLSLAGITASGSPVRCRNYGEISASGGAAGIALSGMPVDGLNTALVAGEDAAGIALEGGAVSCANYGAVVGMTTAGGIVGTTTEVSIGTAGTVKTGKLLEASVNAGPVRASAKAGGLAAQTASGSAVKNSFDMTGRPLFGSADGAAISNVYYLAGTDPGAGLTAASGVTARTPAQMKLASVVNNYLGAYDEAAGGGAGKGNFVARAGGYPGLYWQIAGFEATVAPDSASLTLLDGYGVAQIEAGLPGGRAAGCRPYSLLMGETYAWAASADGYSPQEGAFLFAGADTPEGALSSLAVSLEALPQEAPAPAAVEDDWVPQIEAAQSVAAIRSALSKYAVVKGKSLTIPVAVDYVEGAGDRPAPKWSSSKPGVATVDQNGKVKGVKAGKAVVTAAAGGASKSFQITVTKAAVKIQKVATSVSTGTSKLKKTYTVAKGSSAQIKTTLKGKVSWSTEDKKIATVGKTGLVKAKKVGTATVIAKNEAGKSQRFKVKVVKKLAVTPKVTVKDPPQSLAPGESRDLAVRVSSKVPTGAAVTFRSSNAAVLAVDKAGRLTAVAKGKATVTVKAAGKSCAFEVRVK